MCARTALGLASGRSEKPERPIAIRLIVDHGDGATLEKTFERLGRYDVEPPRASLGYPFPEEVFKVGIDTRKIDATPRGQAPTLHSKKHQAVFHQWTGDEILSEMTNLDDDEQALLASHLLWVRGYLAYSTDVLKQVKTLMGTRSAVVRYGARLVVDQAPQGRALELTLTSDQGLDRQTHIVLGFRSLQLDTGRKFISDERILSAVGKVNQRVVTKLKDYRWALKVRNLPDINSDLASWVQDVAARAGNSFIPELFETLGGPPPSRVNPGNEQEVIALWTALLSRNALSGYQMSALSGFNRYDALFHVTEAALAPVSSSIIAPISTDLLPKENSVLEFKHDFSSLIQDFEQKIKAPHEIDFVVCWDCPELNLSRGSMRATYGSEWRHSRPACGVSYVWSDDNDSTSINVIALRNLVAELLVQEGSNMGEAALAMLEARDKEKLI